MTKRIDWTAYNAVHKVFGPTITLGEERRLAPEEIERANMLLARMREAAAELEAILQTARARFASSPR
mgnify:CR=1 FL=1